MGLHGILTCYVMIYEAPDTFYYYYLWKYANQDWTQNLQHTRAPLAKSVHKAHMAKLHNNDWSILLID